MLARCQERNIKILNGFEFPLDLIQAQHDGPILVPSKYFCQTALSAMGLFDSYSAAGPALYSYAAGLRFGRTGSSCVASVLDGRITLSMTRTSPSGSSLFITYASTNHRIRSGISK